MIFNLLCQDEIAAFTISTSRDGFSISGKAFFEEKEHGISTAVRAHIYHNSGIERMFLFKEYFFQKEQFKMTRLPVKQVFDTTAKKQDEDIQDADNVVSVREEQTGSDDEVRKIQDKRNCPIHLSLHPKHLLSNLCN